MSSVPPGGPDDWDPNDTGAVPVGPEPEPTGAGGAGSGGWGAAPRTEPFAVAALVWAIVSIVLPIIGTIVALVLAARASDTIRRSRGTRSGTGLVTAARVIAGVVLVLWAIGLITFFALRDGDSDNNNVTVPTRPPSTTTTLAPSTTTSTPLTTTAPPTTAPPVTTLAPVVPTTSIVPPPTNPPTTTPPPTEPPTTTTEPPPTTTEPPPTTTTPGRGEERRIERLLLREGNQPNRIGPSNRQVPDDQRVVVTYTPGETLFVTWAIDDGAPPLPEGDATCTIPVPPPTTSTTSPGSTTTSSTTTTLPPGSTTSTAPSSTTSPSGKLSTPELARREARDILNVLRNEIQNGRLDVTGVQLVGTYPIEGATEGDVAVVQVFYSDDDVIATWPFEQAFQVPPATEVQCLNPAFA